MIRGDALYSNLVSLLNSLEDDTEIASLLSGLSSQDEELILSCLENLADANRAILQSRSRGELHEDNNSILDSIRVLMNFPQLVPVFRLKEAYLLAGIVGEFVNSIKATAEEPKLDEDFDGGIFCLHKISENILPKKYIFSHPSVHKVQDSIVYFTLGTCAEIDELLVDISSCVDLILNLSVFIGKSTEVLDGDRYVLINSQLDGLHKLIFSTLCIHLAQDGQVIFPQVTYRPAFTYSWKEHIVTGKAYTQFVDIVAILDELNHQEGILERFLRLYHILENFAYREIIVGLERSNRGQMFTIRDFKRLFGGMAENEGVTLTNFFTKSLSVTIPLSSPVVSFSDRLVNQWRNTLALKSGPEIEEALSRIGVWKKGSAAYQIGELRTATGTQFVNLFSKFVYQMRNSIVHNKETEFHLTNRVLTQDPTIGDTIKILLERFLIPEMEYFLTFLFSIENNIVWYSNDRLILYQN